MDMHADAVVVGVDGTEKDSVAVEWAAAEAHRTGRTLHLVWTLDLAAAGFGHGMVMVDPASLSGDVVETVAKRIEPAYPDLTITSEARTGSPAGVLVAASRQASTVVVGGRGLGRIAGRLLGSVSQKVAAHAHCPVVVVRGPSRPEGPVVVGVSPWDVHDHVLEFAFAQAQRRAVGVRLVHATQSLPVPVEHTVVRQALAEAAQTRTGELDELAETWQERYPDVPVTATVTREHPIDALTDEATTAGLVVVGSRGRRGLLGVRLGSVALGVLHEAPLVAVVPVVGD